ncbi:hypothetical protein [Flavobacterium sp.]|uniref:hypothetical protein n=1 Tax=Flavobacterium sp. TaxID=239 RepID=UPI00286B2EB6|nr:hypothetical protein [Flavobacterium sp.]
MKKSIIYLGIALVVFASVSNVTFNTIKEVKVLKMKSIKNISNLQRTSLKTEEATFEKTNAFQPVFNCETNVKEDFKMASVYVVNENNETIESVPTIKIEKNANQLIAEDNAITENTISNETQALDYNIINNSSYAYEIIESISTSKIEKTADQLIAEDNAITGNTISNEAQALDFNIINNNSYAYEVVESVPTIKIEKTADQLIDADNAITENTISNETYELDFTLINKNQIFIIENNNSLVVLE